MTSRELMIGDWVLAEGNPVSVTGILSLGGDCIECLAPFMSSPKMYKGEDLKYITPIELSDDLVMQFGLKYDDSDIYDDEYLTASYVSEDGRITVNRGCETAEGYIWWVHVDGLDFDSIGSCDISHVHELQHVLRSCGRWDVADNNICLKINR